MEDTSVRYVMPIKRHDNVEDLERAIFVILEWIDQICRADHEAHYIFCIKRILCIDRFAEFRAINALGASFMETLIA